MISAYFLRPYAFPHCQKVSTSHRPQNQSNGDRLPPHIHNLEACLRPLDRPRHRGRSVFARRHTKAHRAETQMPAAQHHPLRHPRTVGFRLPAPKSRRHDGRRPASSRLPRGLRGSLCLRSPARHAQEPRRSPSGVPRLSRSLQHRKERHR